ncbi:MULTISPECIES: ABC transporter ATP-binding protein [Exiguobacterium]|uniref:ABC transporter ATP-binding protein n=1 Tax=Exiguobacterium TaxID=33986 RepID=UPI001BEB42CA|nr:MULTISPECIES: ABC transporter ATP-binding protein [Exiguobacterium]MCT4782709.1 ABC transporter ATP-binding protein [Exiguobacterium himgiriensis]
MDIHIHDVTKSFGKQIAIDRVSFTIHSGEICCLLGPSGSGKTTLIRLMIGALKADEGTVQLGETFMPNMKMLQTIGFMPQNDGLYDDLSAEANLEFFGSIYKLGKTKLQARITDVLALVELTDDRKKLVRHFSGGMKKRLSLAIAILHQPDFLFLDEPTVGIDPLLRRQIWGQFQAIRATGTTIIVSTHVMDEVQECDRAALIYNGRLIAYDTIPHLLGQTDNGRVEELFLIAGRAGGTSHA